MVHIPVDSVVARRVAARRTAIVEAPSVPVEEKRAVSPVPAWVIIAGMFLTLFGLSKLVLTFPEVASILAAVVAFLMYQRGHGLRTLLRILFLTPKRKESK